MDFQWWSSSGVCVCFSDTLWSYLVELRKVYLWIDCPQLAHPLSVHVYLCCPCAWTLQGAGFQSWGRARGRLQGCISPCSSECTESPINTFWNHNWVRLNDFEWICLYRFNPAWEQISPSWTHGGGPPTWLRCSIEFDSRPVFSSRGKVFSSEVLWLPCLELWIRTRAVTSIFPFRPNLGDHTFSSISTSSVTVTTAAESLSLLGALLLPGLESWRQRWTHNQLFKLTQLYSHMSHFWWHLLHWSIWDLVKTTK